MSQGFRHRIHFRYPNTSRLSSTEPTPNYTIPALMSESYLSVFVSRGVREMSASLYGGEGGPAPPIAGKQFPWEYISGGCLRLDSFLPFSKVDGDSVEPAKLGAFGLVIAELPNPDVSPEQRRITLPIE